MKPLHFIGQGDQNEVQYDKFGHGTILVLASMLHDAGSIIAFFMSRQWKWSATWLFGHGILWQQHQHNLMSIKPLHSLGQFDLNRVQHEFLVMSCHWHQHYMIPMILLMVNDNGASTCIRIGTKNQIIPLKYHLNMRAVTVSLIAP